VCGIATSDSVIVPKLQIRPTGNPKYFFFTLLIASKGTVRLNTPHILYCINKCTGANYELEPGTPGVEIPLLSSRDWRGKSDALHSARPDLCHL
jgi:hypothetical protein